MKLRELATVQLGLQDADFWLRRHGRSAPASTSLGEPTMTFNPEYIGIKVTRTDILLPRFLYYLLMNFWQQGMWKHGITVLDVKNLSFKTGGP